MSVIIKGLNKFYSCRLCPFNNSDCYCNITKGRIDRDDYSCEAECPIVQLPKCHGRLIDAEALLKKHPEFDTYPFPSTTIDNAPTIIEADKEYEVEVITRGKCMMCEKELTEGLFFCKECVDKANKRK